jgi:hypothetical protein
MKALAGLAVCAFAIALGASAQDQQPSQGSQQNPPAGANAEKARPKRVHADLSGFDLAPKKPGKDSKPQIGGGTRGGSVRPVLFAPQLGKTYTTTPTFFWGYRDPESDFTVTLYDSDEKELYKAKVHIRRFAYPASAPALKPGATYSWTVRSSSLIAEPAEAVEFVVQTEAERDSTRRALRAIAGDSEEAQVQRAEVFVDARLWYDAVAAYTSLILKNPDDPFLYRSRADIYDQIPATRRLAELDFEHADQLAGSK